MSLSEYANWWDRQKRESEKILGEWVEQNPQWWAVGLATAASTAMDLGAGMVDALRLGQGVAHGGFKGAATDALRLLAVVGPLARGGALYGRFAHTQMIRLAVTTQGVTGPCTFTAVNNALSIVGGQGRNLFLTAREAARALGRPLRSFGKVAGDWKIAAWIDELIPFLTRQGVAVRNLGPPKTLADVVSAASSHDGVVIFAIEWTDLAGKLQRHSMIAVRTVFGVRFADYGGKFIRKLSDLAGRGGIWASKGGYTVASSAGMGSSVVVKGMTAIGAMERHARTVLGGGMLLLDGVHAIETPDGVDFGFPVTATAAIEKGSHEPEVVKASFDAFKARKVGKPVTTMPAIAIKGRRHAPPRPDLLPGVQYRLNAAGFGAGPVDGVVGPRTKRAVTEFQRCCKLTVDGISGPETQQKLVEICGF